MKRTLLVLSITIALAAVAWMALSRGGDTPATAPTAIGPRGSDADAPRGAGHRDATLVAVDGDGGAARAHVGDPDHASVRAPAWVADATWVDVLVKLPAGTPRDEELALVAVSFAPDKFADEGALDAAVKQYEELRSQFEPDASGAKSDGAGEGVEEVQCEPAGENRFRAPFRKGSKVGVLRLSARYAYADPRKVVLPSAAVTLAPALGAWLSVELALPKKLPRDVDPAALPPFEIHVFGFAMSSEPNPHVVELKLEHALEFDVGGLRPHLNYFVRGDSPEFVAFSEGDLKPRAGEHIERRYDLKIGASVSGRVVDERRAGLGGASVRLVQSEPTADLFGGAPKLPVETDAGGRFTIRAIAPGKVSLAASIEERVAGTSRELAVADGDEISDVEIVLGRGHALTGRVTWPDGAPADGVLVHAVATATTKRGEGRSHEELASTSAADGTFAIRGFAAATVDVRASREVEREGAQRTPGTWSTSASKLAIDAEIALVLEAPTVVRGRVIDDLGAPMERFAIRRQSSAKNHTNSTRETIFESADGSFEVGLAPGMHLLSASADGHGTSAEQKIMLPGAVDALTFLLPRVSSISGIVQDPSGAPVAGARVETEVRQGRGAERGDRDAASESDADGRFALKCSTPGGVSLVASKKGWAPSASTPVLAVPGESVSNVVIALRVGGRLEGEIYTQAGAPDPGRQIAVGGFDGGGQDDGATSDAAGRFVVEHLAPGKHTVVAIPKFDQDFGAAGEDAAEPAMMASLKMTTVDIVDGQTTHVVLGAPPKSPVRLSGRVTRGIRPFGEGVVTAIADGKSMLDSLKIGQLDDRGRYQITLDAPGNYTIVVGKRMGDDGAAEFQETIPEVSQYELDLSVPESGIRGRVLSREGAPLAGIPVQVATEGGASIFAINRRKSVTDAEGRFELENLRPGSYTLRANDSESMESGPSEWGIGVSSGVVVEADRVHDDVELRLDRSGEIEGTVLGPDGDPVAGAAVFVRDAQGALLNPTSSCTSDSLGRFTFRGAGAGACTLSARNGNLASRESAPVHVGAGHTPHVELRLDRGTTLRITVEDSHGKLVRANVRVVDESGRAYGDMLGGDALMSWFTEGFSSTEQRIGPLPSGTYKVSASGADGKSVAKSVTVGGQDETALRLRLE